MRSFDEKVLGFMILGLIFNFICLGVAAFLEHKHPSMYLGEVRLFYFQLLPLYALWV